MARGRAPDAAGGRAGAGSSADACHSLPRQEREEGVHCCYLHEGSHLGCVKGGRVTLPGGRGLRKGFPMLGGMIPLIPAGATVFWDFLCSRACAGSTAHQNCNSPKNLAEKVQHPFGR